MRVFLAAALVAKRLGSTELGERVAKDVVVLKRKLADLNREPVERSMYQCVRVFLELFKDASKMNARLLENYTQLGDDDAYECCKSQAARLHKIFVTMEPLVRAAAKSRNALAVTQTVLKAVRHLGEDRLVCCDTSRIENPALLEQVLKMPKTIMGATHYLTKLLRMYEHWDNQSESKLSKYAGASAMPSQQSLQQRSGIPVWAPSGIDQAAGDVEPAQQRDRQAERLQLCAEWGRMKRQQIEEGDRYVATDRIYTPASEPTPEERKKWRELRDRVAEMIRVHQAIGEARRVQAASGQPDVSEAPAPERSADEQRKWHEMQRRVQEMVQLYATLGQEKVARIEQSDQDDADKALMRATAPSAEQVQRWRNRQTSVAEMLRAYEAMGKEKMSRLQNDGDQAQASRPLTAEDRQRWQEMRERVAEMLRQYTEQGRSKRKGATRNESDRSVAERGPAEKQKWKEIQKRMAEMLRLYGELGKEKVSQIEQNDQAQDPNRTARDRSPEKLRKWKEQQNSVAEMLRMYAAIGEQKRKQAAAPSADDSRRNAGDNRERTAADREKWKAHQEKINEMLRLYQALGEKKRTGRRAIEAPAAVQANPRSADDVRRIRETQEGVQRMLRLYEALGRERKARAQQGESFEENAEFERFAKRTPAERANWVNIQKNMFKALERIAAEGREKVVRLLQGDRNADDVANREPVERTEAELELWRAMKRNVQQELERKAAEGKLKRARIDQGDQPQEDIGNREPVERTDADRELWRNINKTMQQQLDRIAAAGQEKAIRIRQGQSPQRKQQAAALPRQSLDPQKWKELQQKARQGIETHAERGALLRSGLPLRSQQAPLNMTAVEMSPSSRTRLLQKKEEEIAKAAQRGQALRKQLQSDEPVYLKRTVHRVEAANSVIRDVLSNGQIRERMIRRVVEQNVQQQGQQRPSALEDYKGRLPVPKRPKEDGD